MSIQRVFIGVLSGLLAGITIGLLVAPAKGSETRAKIVDSADNLRKKIKRIGGTATDELDELKEVFECEIDGLKDDVRERVLKLIETSKASYNHIKQEALST